MSHRNLISSISTKLLRNQLKHIYFFGDGRADGSALDKNLLGSKGANLAEMTSLGIPVPPGFTISTEVCRHYMERMPIRMI